jgi:uncharacterized protein (DUF433 family)
MGFYTRPEAARILHTPPRRIHRWVDGYTFQSGADERVSPPVLKPRLGRERADMLTFADHIQLLFVSVFRREGVTMATIRAASGEAERLFGSDHPFAIRRFETDGRSIFAHLEPTDIQGLPRAQALEDLAMGQMVFEEMTRTYFRKLDYDHEAFTRYWPLGKTRGVVLDRGRAFGQPIDSESGVPTMALFRMVRAGQAPADVADWYQVSEASVHSAVEYEESLLAA